MLVASTPGLVLVATKLHVPDLRPGLVERERLVRQLADDRRLTLLCAPAGWGKTFVLSQWHAQDRRPFAWVSLDPTDDDPIRFWSYVVAGLRTVVPGFGGSVLAALPNAGPGLVEVVLPKLVNELSELSAPIVLVLDDYHVISDELIHASVAFLVRHMPRQLKLVIATRSEPPLPLGRFRAAGELTELRAGDLRFDGGEADRLLNGALALDLAAPDVETLQLRTEGWPAGLQLAALSLRDRGDRGAFIREFAGDDRQIGDYLHEVLEDTPAPMREFLVSTSILDRFNASLCDAVTGGDGAARLLADAYRSNLFLVALDERGQWYRYHHLFRDLLRRELASDASVLHARAAAWHRDNGNVEEAITHALAAGGTAIAVELIARHWLPAWDANPATVARWLQALPPGEVEADARLCMARGWAAMFTGRLDEVGPAIAAAERAPVSAADVDELGTLKTKAAFLQAASAYILGDVGRAHTKALEVRDGAAPASDALASMLIGVTQFFGGDASGALEPLERARGTLAGPGWLQALLTALGTLGAIRADRGEHAVAEQLVRQAEQLMEEHGLGGAPTAALPVTARGKLLDRAADSAGASAAYELAAMLAGRGGWPIDQAYPLLLHAALKRRKREYAAARELTREARLVLARCPDPGMLADLLTRTERAVQLSEERSGLVRSNEALSERELEVLQLLATDLSQREIGERLFVSFNTVKTHTRTLFRKLGASSRADAVARGRDAGLL